MKMLRKSNSEPHGRGMYCHASAHCSDLRISHYNIADDEDMELCMRRPSIDFTSHNSYMCRAPRSSCQALRHAVSALNRLDDFTCVKIGAGFFSEVFKVIHKVTGRVMVLKMNTSQSNRPNMLREVQLMNRLSHSNILRFMGVCVHEGQLHALTEFINGGSLEQHLLNKNEILSWECRVKLALDAAHGLCYLHSRGVFHRDLTSKNILIKILPDQQLRAIVADFGLAEKIPDPLKDSIRLPTVGSPYWMAPECLNGKWYNEKADVFSFGIILCEIIARVEADPDILPRTANFGLDYIAFIEMCSDCPPEFLKLAFSCCRIDPQSRPNFSDVVDQMNNILMTVKKAEACQAGSHESRERSKTNVAMPLAGSPNSHLHAPTRRSKSEERLPIHMSPSDKARCHKFTAKGKLRHVVVPMTLQHIGEVMSLGDPHYCPGASNPFANLLQFREGNKIVCSNKELFSSCFELPSPSSGLTPPNSQVDGMDSSHSGNKKLCLHKGSESLSVPNSPKLLKRTLVRMNSCQSNKDCYDDWSHSKSLDARVFCKCESLHHHDKYQVSSNINVKPSVCQNSNNLVFPKVASKKDGHSPCFDSGYCSIPCSEANHDLLWTRCSSEYQNNFDSNQIIPAGQSFENSWHFGNSHEPFTGNKRPSSCYSDDSGICCSTAQSCCNGTVHHAEKKCPVDKENHMNSVNMQCHTKSIITDGFVWPGSPEYKEYDKNTLPTSPSHCMDTKK